MSHWDFESEVWSAAGVLVAADVELAVDDAVERICDRADMLNVSPTDVAAYVELVGSLPV